MRKRISLKTRRAGLSPSAFRDHYENRHVPLGLEYVDRFQWRRYVRNYVVGSIGTPVGFDGYTEFWVDDDADDDALARFVASPEFAALHEDDARFLDVAARFSGEVVAVPFAATGCGSQGAGSAMLDAAEKVALLWASGETPPADAAARASRIVAPLAERVADATLERVLDPPPGAPFDTLMTIFLVDTRAADVPLDAMPASPWSLLTLDPIETPAHRLFGGTRASGSRVEEHEAEIERTS